MSDNASSPNVWIYARKSRHLGDPDDERIVDHQVARLLRIADERGLVVPPERVVREIGSAETISGRPRFAALLDAWQRLPPDAGGVVLVTEPERLSRGTLVERGRIAEALALADVRIVTPSRVYNLRDPDDEMWFAFTSSLGRRELAVYKQRAKAKVEELLREGAIRNGKAPWGYLWSRDARTLLPDPERFAALRRVCRDVLTTSIVRLAKREGVGISTLNYTLHNPAICGWPAIHTRKDRAGQCWLPREEWRWPERRNDTYPHACARAEWEEIQRVLCERNNRKSKTSGANGWCRDVVRFLDAPYPVGLGGAPRPHHSPQGNYAAFRNGTRIASVSRALVNEHALAALTAIFADPQSAIDQMLAYKAVEHHLSAQRVSPTEHDPAQILAELRHRYQQTVDAEFDAQEPLRAALITRRRRLESEVNAAQSALRAANARPESTAGAIELVDRVIAANLPFADQWLATPEEARRALVNACIARIECRARDEHGRRLVGAKRVLRVVMQPWFRNSSAEPVDSV